MPKFHDLVAFQRAVDLTAQIYEITQAFPKQEMYGLTAQMRRAALGVPSNIAEGQGRLTYGEWRQFLSQARGSLFEIEAQATVAERLRFLTAEEHSRITVAIRKTGRALIGLIRWVKKQEASKPRNLATPQPRNPATG